MTYGYVSELKQEFRAEGEALMLLNTLEKLGLEPSADDRERIRSCTDHEQLFAWCNRAVTATTMAEVFGE